MIVATRKLSLLLLFLALSIALVTAADNSSPPTLDAATPGAASPSEDGGSISSPAGGSDAKKILADTSHVMGNSADSTDGDDHNSHKRDDKNGATHHGECVTGCATKATDGVGCGNDLSKPNCFCKSESFIDQTFACINATCPAQFHGAAGVVTSLCAGAGTPGLKIPGYNSSNLENMPTFDDDDDGKNNKTNSTTPSAPEGGTGTTSTFSMPPSFQTPNAGNIGSVGSGAKGGNATSAGAGATSGVARRAGESALLAGLVTATVAIASVGVWTLI